MGLEAGARLGSYEMGALLGKGGMGEVYRARDTRLGREVALKVLPVAFASDAERMARFEREAQVLASLNHPNIAVLYGLEEAGGVRALAMELVEGATIAECLEARPLPIEEAVPIARQVAEALEAAHEKGIVHRDLKPANIKVREDGTVKVLDFGLAKAIEGDPAVSDQGHSPTLSLAPTRAGVILGTAGYMSPEQARGSRVDARADIWAFGVVLLEMLTGKPVFRGETVSDTLAAVLRADVDWSALPADTPPVIRGLLRRCLDRDRKQRLQSIGEARILLAGPLAEAATPIVAAASAPAPRLVGWMAAVAVLALALAAVSILLYRQAPPEQQAIRFQVPPPARSAVEMMRLSPDGRFLAFTAHGEGRSQLWVRPLDSLETQPLRGTEGARYPFWSPDSASLAFFAQGKLKKIAITGGPAQILCDASDGRGGAWNRDGVIVFSPGPGSGLERVAAAGGVPAVLTKPEAGANAGHRFPEFLPDGRRFLFQASSDKAETSGLYAGSLDGTPPVRIRGGPSNAVFAPPVSAGQRGLLLFREENTLMAQPFDPARLAFGGDMVPVAEQVGQAGNAGHGAFTVAANGALAYRTGVSFRGEGNRALVWLDRAGKRLSANAGKPGLIRAASLSPDEKRIGLSIASPEGLSDIWLLDVGRATLTRFTFGPGVNSAPVWSPDGSRVAFFRIPTNTGVFEIYQKATAGAGQERLLGGAINTYPNDWSPDGKFLVYSTYSSQTRSDLWLLPLAGDHKPTPYLQTLFNETSGQFSPDGRWMAYVSDESGQEQVYVQPVPVSGAKWQVSTAGGSQPRWRRDGRELFYLGADGQLMAAPVQTGAASGSFEAETPQVLFELRGALRPAAGLVFGYQPAANGQRFLAIVPAEGEAEPPVTVVLNWQAGLKR